MFECCSPFEKKTKSITRFLGTHIDEEVHRRIVKVGSAHTYTYVYPTIQMHLSTKMKMKKENNNKEKKKRIEKEPAVGVVIDPHEGTCDSQHKSRSTHTHKHTAPVSNIVKCILLYTYIYISMHSG